MSAQQFGRKYRIQIANGNNIALDVSDLRCTFQITKIGADAINFAEISIYNLNDDTMRSIVNEGARVIVQAGYVNGAFGVIFDGDIFQIIWDRENVVDYRMTIHCMDGDNILNDNFVSFTFQANQETREDLLTMLNRSDTKIPVGNVTSVFDSNAKRTRGKTFFGQPRKYIRQMALQNNADWCIDDGQLYFTNRIEVNEGQALVITPQNGLLGVPIQTPEGVNFRVLLNPNITIKYPVPMQVQLDLTIIRMMKRTPEQTLQTRLDQNGVYKVIAITHIGDTRGNDWYTDVTGWNLLGKIPIKYSVQ